MRHLFLSGLFLVISLTLSSSFGNGSSGVGNSPLQLTKTVFTSNAKGTLERKGGAIVDVRTQAPLLKISKMSAEEFTRLTDSGRLVEARLGGVKAFEALILKDTELNFWVFCEKKETCIQIKPQTRNDPRIAEIIGALVKKKK